MPITSPAKSALPPGGRLDLGEPGDEPFVGRGWYRAENIGGPQGRWAGESVTSTLRLVLPEAGFTLSTRESPAFRDRLIPLGVTMMSAGSSTRPGGYATSGKDTLEQFEIEDNRSPAQVAQAIKEAGYDPVWKDFDRAFVPRRLPAVQPPT